MPWRIAARLRAARRAACVALAVSGARATTLVANDDSAAPDPPSTVTFYDVGDAGRLGTPHRVSTEGNGVAGGFFGAARVVATAQGDTLCVFASAAQSETIAAFAGPAHRLAGVFGGSHADTRLARGGIALAADQNRVWASFSGAGTLGTFRILPGCRLAFLGDVPARGVRGGEAEALAARGGTLLAAYGDGSLESFDVSGDIPRAHGDRREAAEASADFAPGAIAISPDGRWALASGGATRGVLQVIALAGGRLGAAQNALLTPDWGSGSLAWGAEPGVLFMSHHAAGRVSAGFFDSATGRVRPGCTSEALRGFGAAFRFIGGVAVAGGKDAGAWLYVPEFDAAGQSAIAVLHYAPRGAGCDLAEAAFSPVRAGPGSALLSIAILPPPF